MAMAMAMAMGFGHLKLTTIMLVMSAFMVFWGANAHGQSDYEQVIVSIQDLDPEPPGYSAPGTRYGADVVRIGERTIVAGRAGRVLVYSNALDDGEIEQVIELPGRIPDSIGYYDVVLAVQGNHLLIADRNVEGSPEFAPGAVHVYVHDSGQFQMLSTLRLPVEIGAAYFGFDLAPTSTYLFVALIMPSGSLPEVAVYDWPEDPADLHLQQPEFLPFPPVPSEWVFLSASEDWLVMALPSGSVSSRLRAFNLGDASHASYFDLEIPDVFAPFTGDVVHVHHDVALVATNFNAEPFGPVRVGYRQIRLAPDGPSELPPIVDPDPDRHFSPNLGSIKGALYLVSWYRSHGYPAPDERLVRFDWTGASWQGPVTIPGLENVGLERDDISNIGSIWADTDRVFIGQPLLAEMIANGGGLVVLDLESETVGGWSILTAGKPGFGRRLGWSIAHTDTRTFVGAPGWCTVYVLDRASGSHELLQTLTVDSPCGFGASITASGDRLFVGDIGWVPPGFPSGLLHGRVWMYRKVEGAYQPDGTLQIIDGPIGLMRFGAGVQAVGDWLYVRSFDELHAYESPGDGAEPAVSKTLSLYGGQTRRSLVANENLVVAGIGGSLGGKIEIFSPATLMPMGMIERQFEYDFGTDLAIVAGNRILTAHLNQLTLFAPFSGQWLQVQEIFPNPHRPGFPSGLASAGDEYWIGEDSGLVLARVPGTIVSLNVSLPFGEPAYRYLSGAAPGDDPLSVIVGLQGGGNLHASGGSLLLVDYEVVIFRDGFEP